MVDEATRLRREELARILAPVPATEKAALVTGLHHLNAAAGEVPDQDWSTGCS